MTAIRLLGSLVIVGFCYVALRGLRDSNFEATFGEFLASMPRWLVSGIVGFCQVVFLVAAVLAFMTQIVLRRFMRVGRMLLAGAVAAGGLFVMSKLVGADALPLGPPRLGSGSTSFVDTSTGLSGYGIGAAFPTTLDLGVLAAWMFIDRVHWSDLWRRVGFLVLVLGIVARLGVSFADPATIITAVAIAAAASSVVQLILGALNTSPRAAVVGDILVRLGYKPSSVERFGGFHGFAGFRIFLDDGQQLIAKVINR
ncbi:MAG TPA: hypothetical protein VIH06_06090, partial [Ilumatobacteraceae bacterium]